MIDALADGTLRGDRSPFSRSSTRCSARTLAAARRLPLLPRSPGRRGARLPGSRALDAAFNPEHGAHGALLVGPLDPRLLSRRLARRAGADRDPGVGASSDLAALRDDQRDVVALLVRAEALHSSTIDGNQGLGLELAMPPERRDQALFAELLVGVVERLGDAVRVERGARRPDRAGARRSCSPSPGTARARYAVASSRSTLPSRRSSRPGRCPQFA